MMSILISKHYYVGFDYTYIESIYNLINVIVAFTKIGINKVKEYLYYTEQSLIEVENENLISIYGIHNMNFIGSGVYGTVYSGIAHAIEKNIGKCNLTQFKEGMEIEQHQTCNYKMSKNVNKLIGPACNRDLDNNNYKTENENCLTIYFEHFNRELIELENLADDKNILIDDSTNRICDGTPVALKSPIHNFNEFDGVFENIQNEARILSELKNNANIVQFGGIAKDNNGSYYIITELLDTTLYEVNIKRKHSCMPHEKLVHLFKCILNGLAACHNNKIIHQDIKLKNILTSTNLKFVKIADFGMAKKMNYNQDFVQLINNEIVSLWQRAPEIILKSIEYDYKIDIWALGCIMFELCAGYSLFAGANEFDVITKICNLNKIEYIQSKCNYNSLVNQLTHCNYAPTIHELEHVSKELRNLIESCLVFNYKYRPSAEELLKNKLFL